MKLETIISWAKQRENIHAAMLTGSRVGRAEAVDPWSDYDIALVVGDFRFLDDDQWLKQFPECWVCIHDRFEMLNFVIPTRLAIFSQKFKVDFAFYPEALIRAIAETKELPDGLNLGYEILLDKNGILSGMPKPTYSGFIMEEPDEAEYKRNVNEFWFEVFHVVKYLDRGDLWTAKGRDWDAKQFLLQMIHWRYGSQHGWNFNPRAEGKDMFAFTAPKIREKLQACFGNFDRADMLQALRKTAELYREVASETGRVLGYDYDQKLDDHISGILLELRS
ncbi:MAG: aminoglycoside 6-adenylyltransferase [Bacteroidota bacterium]